MHRPIDVASNQVDVRFQYSCGYTTAFSDLARCRFGDAAPSPAALVPDNVGATVVNKLTCDIPFNTVPDTVDIAVSLNGVDFTVSSAVRLHISCQTPDASWAGTARHGHHVRLFWQGRRVASVVAE